MDLNKIKNDLLKIRCTEHKKHAEISVKGKKLEFKCCCEKFKQILVKKSEALITEAAKNDIEKSLKNIFK
jgi:hypothetical protein